MVSSGSLALDLSEDTFGARVAELEALLDAAQVEDFSVINDEGSITDVARELLVRAGCL